MYRFVQNATASEGGVPTACGAVAILLGLGFSAPASAHCIVGNRFFPATLNVDDPCVADELSLPTIAAFKNGDDPSAQELDISGEYSKTITENFGVSSGEDWLHLNVPGEGNHAGFDNLATSFKYQFVRDAAGELAMSASLDVDWGGTGSSAMGADHSRPLPRRCLSAKASGFSQSP